MSQKTAAASRSVVLASDQPGIPLASNVVLPDSSAVTMVGTTQSKFVDNFIYTGNTFNPAKWNIARNLNGISITTGASNTTVSIPTTSGAELLLIGAEDITIPANLTATFSLSARSTTTLIRIGYVAVGSDNLPIAHATLTGDFAHRVNANYGHATATSLYVESVADSLATPKQITLTSQVSTASSHELNLEARTEDITVATATPDSTAVRIAGGRISSVVPDSNTYRYRPFIWIINTAASTAATLTLQRFCSLDIQELQAEVGGGRGNAAASQAIPVAFPTTPTVVSNLGTVTVNTTATGATLTKLIAAATTNATLVKGSAGKVVGGIISNLTASWKFVKFYNKATAPTVGTDTPVFTIPVAPNSNQEIATMFDQYGISFATGIGYAITGAIADLDTTAVAAGDVMVNLAYV